MSTEVDSKRWWITAVLVIVGPLVGVIAGWWLSAEAAREEALRAERRGAYVSLLSNTSECVQHAFGSLSEDVMRETAEELAQEGDTAWLDLLDSPEAQQILDEATPSVSELQDCTARLWADRARVGLVADSRLLDSAAQELQRATLEAIAGEDEERGDNLGAYSDALVDFETAARRSINEPVPVIPSGLVALTARIGAATLLATVLMGIATVVLGRISRDKR